MLGVQPFLGRVFNDADCAPGAPRTVVLSERLWRKNFGADPRIVGREVRIGDVPHTVIGVMPANFAFPDEERADATRGVWLPSEISEVMRKERGFTIYALIARLRPGVSEQTAAAELATITANVKKLDPDHTTMLHFCPAAVPGDGDGLRASGVPGTNCRARAGAFDCVRECGEFATEPLPGASPGIGGAGCAGCSEVEIAARADC